MAHIGLQLTHLASALREQVPVGLLHKSAWAAADQALVSATNFSTLVLVARVLPPHEFGLYSLTYTVLLIMGGVQSSLVVQPHINLGAPRSGADYISYTTDTAWLQVGLGLITALAIFAIGAIMNISDMRAAHAVFALAVAAPFWQLQEFPRRAMYVQAHISDAFVNDILSYGGQLALILVLWRGETLNPVTAILAIAGSSAVASVLGVWQIRDQLDRTLYRPHLGTTLKENWRFGRWLLCGDLTYWSSGHIYPVLTAGLVSLTGTGVLRASQTIMGPTHILLISMGSLLSPRAARIHAIGGIQSLRRFLSAIEILIIVTMGVYCLIAAIFAEQILRYVYSPAYAEKSWLLVIYSTVYFLSAVRTPINIGLKAIGQTSAIFRIYLASGALNLTIGVALVYSFGLIGVAIGLVMNALTLLMVTGHYQRRYLGTSAGQSRSDSTKASMLGPLDRKTT